MTSPLHSDGTHIKTPFVGLVGEPNGLWNPHPNQAAAFPPTRSASAPKPSPVGSPGPTLHPQPLPSPVDRSGDGGRAGARPGSARAHRLATASRSTRSRFCLHFRVNKSPTDRSTWPGWPFHCSSTSALCVHIIRHRFPPGSPLRPQCVSRLYRSRPQLRIGLRGGHLSGLGSPADRPWPARSGRSSRCRCSSPWIPERSHERVRGRTATVVSKDHTRIGLTGWS